MSGGEVGGEDGSERSWGAFDGGTGENCSGSCPYRMAGSRSDVSYADGVSAVLGYSNVDDGRCGCSDVSIVAVSDGGRSVVDTFMAWV